MRVVRGWYILSNHIASLGRIEDKVSQAAKHYTKDDAKGVTIRKSWDTSTLFHLYVIFLLLENPPDLSQMNNKLKNRH